MEFLTLASRSWLACGRSHNAFLHGLADYVKDKLVASEIPSSLGDAIELAIWVDLRVQMQQTS